MTKVIRINMSGTWQLGIGASGVLGLKREARESVKTLPVMIVRHDVKT